MRPSEIDTGSLKTQVQQSMKAENVTVTPSRDHTRLAVVATRGEAILKFELHDGKVTCTWIDTKGVRGWLQAAETLTTEVLGPVFDVRYVEISPSTEKEAKAISKRAPYKPVGDGIYRWELT